MQREMGDRIDAVRDRTIASLHRAIESALVIIEANHRLAEYPEHAVHANQLVDEGEAELADLRAQLEQLESAKPARGSG